MTETSFPRQYARTRRFSLGVPHAFVISPDGARVLFLRSRSGVDAETCLYELDVASGVERLLADPGTLGDAESGSLPAEERARRERARESSAGIVRFHCDTSRRRVVFDLGGRLFLADVATGQIVELPVERPAIEGRLSPPGDAVAYVSGGALRIVDVPLGTGDRCLAAPEGETTGVTYGLAEFVAAEEMGRGEGYWWAPDGRRLLVARVDTDRVERRHIADPATPTTPPVAVAYPAAGTCNAEVRLFVVDREDGGSREVRWDRAAFEYVTRGDWSEHGLLVVVQSRDQRRVQVLAVDRATGDSTVLREDGDDVWLDVVDGVPAHLRDGTLIWTADVGEARRLLAGDEAVTPESFQVHQVLAVDGDTVLVAGSSEPTEIGVWTWSPTAGLARCSGDVGPGVASAALGGGTTVLAKRCLERSGVDVTVHRDGREVGRVASLAEVPVLSPRPLLRSLGERAIRSAVLFPCGHEPGSGPLPVLLDPYGGPHAQMVLAASSAFLTSQWFADLGFAVLVADGRGTPGRGPSWDRAVAGDLASPALEDQVSALQAAAEEFPDLDLGRVAIRGWSFGGFLAALAVLRRPDVFHAAVAGAPVTEWRLYDTHYTERYLGDPTTSPEVYDRSSLLCDAARLQRPLMIIHGLADDNVAVANTLQLSSALLAAGRPHTVLPLSGVTHMTPQEIVAENLLLLQAEFLQRALADRTGAAR